jgi:hypothetical protein
MSYQPMAPPPPPATATSATPVVKTKIRPGAGRYWLGGILIAAGVIGALVILGIWAARTSDAVDNFARMRVTNGQGDQAFTFTRSGTYTLYYEYRSEVDGEEIRNGDHDAPSQLAVVVKDANGATIPTRSYDDDFSFSFNDKLGPAFARVSIPAAGVYELSVTADNTQPFVVAIGKGVLQSIWPGWLLGAIGAFVVGVGLGLALIITTAVKRGRRKRELRRAAATTTGTYGYGVPAAYAPAPQPGPSWTPPPASTPDWGVPGAPPAESAPPPAPAPAPTPPSEDPWGPPGA